MQTTTTDSPSITASLPAPTFITEPVFFALLYEVNEHLANADARIADLTAEVDSLNDRITQLEERGALS